jgi:hypothetical protein
VIEVYAITDQADRALPVGFELERVRHEGMCGVYGRVADLPRASADALWRHERLIETLMEDRTVLPLRFGTSLADEWELKRVMTERADEFAGLLDQVRGRVELALRVLEVGAGDESDGRPSSGRAYMETLARRRKSAEQAVAALEPLEDIAAAARKRDHSGDLTRLSFLVERDRVDAFKERLEQLRGQHPELSMTCTGPWPPYSFVSAGP